MSWLKQAQLDIPYYVTIAPEVYYEWEYRGSIPSGQKLSYGDPKAKKTLDQMVLSVTSSSDFVDDDYLSKCDIPISNIKFISGNASSKSDIIEKLGEMNRKFQNGLDRFKEGMSVRVFFIEMSDKIAKLCSVGQCDATKLEVSCYGSWNQIVERVQKAQIALDRQGRPRGHKALDLSALHKLTHALLHYGSNLPLDKEYMKVIVQNSDVKPTKKSMSWKDLYTRVDDEAKQIQQRINKISGLSWVQEFCRSS